MRQKQFAQAPWAHGAEGAHSEQRNLEGDEARLVRLAGGATGERS